MEDRILLDGWRAMSWDRGYPGLSSRYSRKGIRSLVKGQSVKGLEETKGRRMGLVHMVRTAKGGGGRGTERVGTKRVRRVPCRQMNPKQFLAGRASLML